MPATSHVVVYPAGVQTTPDERAAIVELEGIFDLVEVRPFDHLNRHTGPVCDYVFALAGAAGVPSAAKNIPLYDLGP
jgi:hypothetical protein